MNFNVEDPLAGILSDGSDDSFFDDDVLGKKKPVKKKSTPVAERKSALFDISDNDTSKPLVSGVEKKESLFAIDTKKSSTSVKRNDSTKETVKFSHVEPKTVPSLDKLEISKSPVKPKLSISTDKVDYLSDLLEPKKETSKLFEKGKSSQSLLDDILKESGTKSSQAQRPVTAAKGQDFDIESILGKGDARTSQSSKSLPQKPSFKEKQVRDKKEDASAKKSKSSDDWLGIFQDKKEDSEFEDDSGMPSWLVGGDAKKKKVDDKKSKDIEKSTEPENLEQAESKKTLDISRALEAVKPSDNIKIAVPTPTLLLANNEDVTAEGAALYLQEQEAQLMIALQLKAHEEKLAAMQLRQNDSNRVQRESAQAQHAVISSMLQRQAENRQQMQNIITLHQEKITERIKSLLGTENVESENVLNQNETHEPGDRRETPFMREKKQLLQLVQSLQENHDKEIDLMETSYRRQLAYIELTLSQSEERMKEESDKLVRFYTEKIEWLEEHHNLYKKMAINNLNDLTDRHKAENEMLRLQYMENVRVLQENHAALIENVKKVFKQEQAIIEDSAGFSSDLKELVSDVKDSKRRFEELVEKVQAFTENGERKTDSDLQTRETHISDMIQQLKKERENFDVEKSENREIVKMLEIRLRQMTTMIEEESATLKQKRMEFEFEKATFNKQTEFAKNILKNQDEEIKMLRDDILKEYQEKNARVDEEKAKAIKESAALAREKSAIQNLKQELEKMKAELGAHLEEVTEERSKLNVEKQHLHMEEQRILAKTRDLDLLAKSAIDKQTQAEKKYAEAEFLLGKYEERIRRIQEQVVSINNREKQIAKEKVMLSRERLTLHNEKKQIENRQQCSLCKSTQNPQIYSTNFTYPESYVNAAVTREYRTSNMTSTTPLNTMDLEMSQLIGRNLNLRHCAGMGDLSQRDEIDTEERFRNFEGQRESVEVQSRSYREYLDPKFMMLRLDVQKVLSNIDSTNKQFTEAMTDETIDEK